MNTTALSTETRSAPPPAKAPVQVGGPLAALTPQNIDEAFRLATALAGAGDMVPRHFQGNPQATMAAIVRGMEIGLAPMQALSSIAVVNGRPMIYGDALPALMQRAGHHVDVEYEGSGDSLTAVATLTRGDSGKSITRRFGMTDAKRAGLLGKQGPWMQYTARMLAHRARSWAIRDGAADALMGLHIADDGEHVGPEKARDVTPSPRRGGVVYADPEPEAAEVAELIDPAPLTDADRKRLAAEARAESDRLAGEGGE